MAGVNWPHCYPARYPAVSQLLDKFPNQQKKIFYSLENHRANGDQFNPGNLLIKTITVVCTVDTVVQDHWSRRLVGCVQNVASEVQV